MLTKKRKLPKELIELDKRVEAWKLKTLRDFQPNPYTSLMILSTFACASIAATRFRMQSLDGRFELEQLTRVYLFSLQFAIHDLARIDPHFSPSRLAGDDDFDTGAITKAESIMQALTDYVALRDIFHTYQWGGYELASVSEDCAYFTDSDMWLGAEDRAQTLMAQHAKKESIDSGLINEFDLPDGLDLDGLSAQGFFAAWAALATELWVPYCQGFPPEVEESQIHAIIKAGTELTNQQIARFVELVTFDVKGTQSQLSLFHCPLVPLANSMYLLIAPAFFSANLTTVVSRVAIIRGPGMGEFSKTLEAHLLSTLSHHYGSSNVIIKTNISYGDKEDHGDIDLVVYEREENRLLLSQVKAFVLPDTVEEVIRTNEQIQQALSQVERVKYWLKRSRHENLPRLVQGASFRRDPEVHHVVIANGSCGSDYLRTRATAPIVDARFLLLDRFRGGSIFEAIESHENELGRLAKIVKHKHKVVRLELAGIRFKFPAWEETL